jgi:P4 family phage/plasmid primase-like protien
MDVELVDGDDPAVMALAAANVPVQKKSVTNAEAASLFYEENPHKYVLHRDWGCYELGPNNVWVSCGKELPSTCRQDISVFLKALLPSFKPAGSTSFLNNVKSLLQDLYTVKTLVMDAQDGVFCFSDCIYDLKTRERRPIEPEDYISTTCGYPYPTSNAAKKAEVVKFLKSLHENDETYAYLLKMLAYTCIGGNPLQLFFILTGAGGNGKGMLMKLMKLAMGAYYGTVMIDLFTRAHDESKPSPTLVKVRTSRLVVAEEPEPYQKFKDGFLKMLSGHTPITCRLLHSNHVITYVAQFVVFLLCNAIPEFASIDAAVARRIHIVPFPFNFRAHPTAPNERLADPDLDGNIHGKAWRNEMILLLLDHISPTLEKCPAVELATADFIDRADPVAAFLRDFYVEDDKAARIQSEDLRRHYNEQYPTQQQSQFEFKQSLDKLKVRSTLLQHVRYYFGLRPKPVATEVEHDPKNNIYDRNNMTMDDF